MKAWITENAISIPDYSATVILCILNIILVYSECVLYQEYLNFVICDNVLVEVGDLTMSILTLF